MSDEKIKQATEQVITEMLTESTGKHFMDSGDTYGRHWEDNRKNGIKKGKQPLYAYRNDKNKTAELEVTIPIFDYLSLMEYTEDCQMLESLLPNLNFDVLHYIEDVIKNPSNYQEELKVFQENQYFGSKVGNTYNGEDLLSQGFQYIWFEYEGEDYIAISIHNGCDIRGGYTDIHIFKAYYSEEIYFVKSEANIYCKCGMHNYWQSEVNHIEYWLNDDEVNEKFVYAHSYKDNDGILRCKYCNEPIVSEIRSI